jgi:hypothetical protein
LFEGATDGGFKLLEILGCVVDYARATAARAIKNLRSLRIVGSMTSGPERPDAA